MAPNIFLLSCLYNNIKGPPPLMTVPITPLASAQFFVFSPHLITLQFIYKYIVTLTSFLYLDHARYVPSSGTSQHGSYFLEHSFFHSFYMYHQSSPLLFCKSLFKSLIRPFLITLNCKVHFLSPTNSSSYSSLFPWLLLPYPQLYGLTLSLFIFHLHNVNFRCFVPLFAGIFQ